MTAVHYREGRFPPEDRLDWPALVPLLGPAHDALGRYDGMLAAIPNPGVLLAPLPLGTQEAVLSSRIEGTQATMGEVLEFEAIGEESTSERQRDFEEVLNYRAAMELAEEMLETLPLSLRVIREAHRALLSGVRGRNSSPGEYRRGANCIGPPGCTVDTARFVPPGAEKLADGMSAWERYMHQDTPDRLVQAAILHAEFEALHPFLDGNGRLGRMLVPLFLWRCDLIRHPVFYISAFLEARRADYYEGLLAVSRDDDWTGWCKFFLEGVRAQAEDNLKKAKAILDLYEDMKRQVPESTRSRYAIQTLDWIFKRPVFRSVDFATEAGIPKPTARRVLRVLQQSAILKVVREGRGRRSSVLLFPALLNIVEGEELF